MKKRVRGIEPPCAAWEAAVLPLNYTREGISDFRFSNADCNQNNSAASAHRCALFSEDSGRYSSYCAKITATKSRRRRR